MNYCALIHRIYNKLMYLHKLVYSSHRIGNSYYDLSQERTYL